MNKPKINKITLVLCFCAVVGVAGFATIMIVQYIIFRPLNSEKTRENLLSQQSVWYDDESGYTLTILPEGKCGLLNHIDYADSVYVYFSDVNHQYLTTEVIEAWDGQYPQEDDIVLAKGSWKYNKKENSITLWIYGDIRNSHAASQNLKNEMVFGGVTGTDNQGMVRTEHKGTVPCVVKNQSNS